MTSEATVLATKNQISLSEAQAFVGGYVEVLILKNGDQMLINEEGMYMDHLLPNPMATTLAVDAGYMVPSGGIKGNAVILQGLAKWD